MTYPVKMPNTVHCGLKVKYKILRTYIVITVSMVYMHLFSILNFVTYMIRYHDKK